MDSDNQLYQAFAAVSIVQLARDLGIELREGAGQRSPFREDRKAGSVEVKRDRYIDYAHEEHSCGHIGFVQLARPGWGKKEAIEFVIRAAGMEPQRQSAGAVKALMKEKREKLFSQAQAKAADIPKLEIEEPPPMDGPIRERWNEGQAVIADYMEKLADSRGWPESAVRALVGMNKTSLPLLPWSDTSGPFKSNKRGWGFVVEKPVFDQRGRAALVPVGFHARYKIYSKTKPTEKRWIYCPYKPVHAPGEFQKYLQRAKWRLPAYPFVLGDLNNPRLVVILEGQFDAVSFALAFGWLPPSREASTFAKAMADKTADRRSGIPKGVVVMGLRGVSSPSVFLAAYGRWLKRCRPFVWLLPDNDSAGRQLITRKHAERIGGEPCFVDRLRAIGCTVKGQILEVDGCKDFNDIWRAHKPTVEQMEKFAVAAGCGEFVKGE